VLVQFFGDSTQEQQGGNLQIALDMALGPGRALVENLGVSGTTAADFPGAKVKHGAITVANYGINDSRSPGATVTAYKASLRKIAPAFFETPSPPFDGYAQAMREVADEMGRPVIDVSAQVRALPGWETRIFDGVHPDPGLYGIIARDIVAPALADAVRRANCQP
jgi:lysophospholipase L1-like esterase